MISGRKGKPARERTASAARQGFLAALDIGTHKIACFIAQPEARPGDDGPTLRVIGIGHHLSRGVRAGSIVDMERAESAIRAAVEAAERMADVTVKDIVVNVSCGQPKSETIRVEQTVGSREITDLDLKRLLNLGRLEAEREARTTIHATPLSYTVDGTPRIRDPRGMFGDRMGATLHAVSVQDGPLQNVELCVERCHLGIAQRVLAPYASGLASLVHDEMDLGVTVIDMGAGTTSIAVFFEGAMIFADVVPLGGASITNDIARGLSTPVVHAERMKTLYGSALAAQGDDRETITVPQVGEEETDSANHVPRSMLTGIIRPRLEEIFELARDRLQVSGVEAQAGRRVVLTGGASQLTGARDLAQRILNKQTRLGRPLRLSGLAEATGGSAFATCAGLLSYAQMTPHEAPEDSDDRLPDSQRASWARFSQWLKENL